jgi:hypothetical protein
MATCEVCGNDYDKSFEVVTAGADTVGTRSTRRPHVPALRMARARARRRGERQHLLLRAEAGVAGFADRA